MCISKDRKWLIYDRKSLNTIELEPERIFDLIKKNLNKNLELTIEKTIQLIKGESSRWINKNNLLLENTDYSKFEWQDEYYGVSVSPKSIDTVREYIKNQEEHHKIKSFNEEYNEFMNEHGFQEFK